jgi:putative flippase GtrA
MSAAVPRRHAARLRFLRELLGYGGVAVIALAADAALLWFGVTRLRLPAQPCAALSFTAGAVVAWWLSTRVVFSQHRLRHRGLELLIFTALGTVGLAINALVLFVTLRGLGWTLLAGKACSAGATFSGNFLLRRQLLFTARPARGGAPALDRGART